MSEAAPSTPGAGTTYDVVVLVEQALTPLDAGQVRSLHEDIGETVVYHVLHPVEDAAGRIEAAMGSLAGGEAMASPALVMDRIDIEQVRQECLDRSRAALEEAVSNLRKAGATADGTLATEHPVDALIEEIDRVQGREAIILTRPHVVAEFFHVDWTSRARRRLGVPVLHLLEHETFDEAGEGPEGASGM